jgi:hypothetical protein
MRQRRKRSARMRFTYEDLVREIVLAGIKPVAASLLLAVGEARPVTLKPPAARLAPRVGVPPRV